MKPLQKDLDKNVYPHIVAIGPSKKGISHFYIAIENHLIDVSLLLTISTNKIKFDKSQVIESCIFVCLQVPSQWDFNQIVDLFFKVHMVFDIKFEINIKPTMTFLAAFLYKFEGSAFKPTLSMTNWNNKIKLAINDVAVIDED